MSPYKQLWRVVDGSVADAFNRHPDYLTPKGRKSARASITKRVTGTVLSFAVQAAKSQRELAETALGNATPDVQVSTDLDAGAGTLLVSPTIHRVRIRNVRLKRRSRYRSPDAFNITTSKLLRSVSSRLNRDARGKGEGE